MGRGLHNFIRDLKNAATPDKEAKRVREELAKIRAKFRGEKELDTYSKKKYVWKLLYIFMLGYEVDFGVIEAIALLALSGYAEKSCGYLAVTLLLDEEHDMMQLVINSVRRDLVTSGDTLCPEYQCLALAMLSNLGAGPFMEELCPLVTQLLVNESKQTPDYVQKKAALCLVNMNRSSGGEYVDGEDMAGDVLAVLDGSSNIGLCTSVMSLLLSMVSTDKGPWSEAPRVVASLLHKARMNERQFAKNYTYFQIPSPWLQIKCMRLLQYFAPPEDALSRKQLMGVLEDVITKTDISKKNQNKINALHAIFFEAINLLNHLCSFDMAAADDRRDVDPNSLLLKAVDHLGKFLTDGSIGPKNKNLKMANVRYLALDTMSRLAVIDGGAELLKQYADSFIEALTDEDYGIRRRALDVLYEMAGRSTAAKIVDHFLDFLVDAEDDVREELVLKVAILAERFATRFEWYVDVILRLIQVAGSAVSDEIWHRVVYIVTNNDGGGEDKGLHKYAAGKVFAAVSEEGAHENMVKIAAYMLGEFGHHISDEPGCSYAEQLAVLQSKFSTVGGAAKGIVLSAYIKLRNNEPSLGPQVIEALRSCCSHVDQEVQQRACEYVMFTGLGDSKPDLLPTVFEAMDFFPDRDNPLVQRLLDSASHGREADHVLSKKRDKTDRAETDPADSGGDLPPHEPEPEPAPADEVGDLLGLGGPAVPVPAAGVEAPLAASPPLDQPQAVASPPITGGAEAPDMTDAQLGGQGMAIGVMPSALEARVAVPEAVFHKSQIRDKFKVMKDGQLELGCVLQVDKAAKRATVTFFIGKRNAPASSAV